MGACFSGKGNKTAPLTSDNCSHDQTKAAAVIQSRFRGKQTFDKIQRVKKLFDEADSNKDGITTRIEFLDMLVDNYQGAQAAELQKGLGLPPCSGGSEKAVWLFKEACYRAFKREGKSYQDEIQFSEFAAFLDSYTRAAMNTIRLRRQANALGTPIKERLSEWERPIMGHHNFMGPVRHALKTQVNMPPRPTRKGSALR